MSKSIKKPRSFISLAAQNGQGQVANSDELHRVRIARLSALKQRSTEQQRYISEYSYHVIGDTEEGKMLNYFSKRMFDCSQYLLFRNYYEIGVTKLVKAHTCQIHLLCAVCAHNRAARAVRAYSERFDVIRKQNPRLKPILITLTVKNGSDLQERFDHLRSSFKNLLDRRRDWKSKGRGFVEFCKIQGAVYSYEVTRNPKTKEWHPHIHMFALCSDFIDRDELIQEWHEITQDSTVVDVRMIRSKTEIVEGKRINTGYGKAFCEVFKYAMKFSDMTPHDTLQAFCELKGKRLQDSFGLFRGIEIPDQSEDEGYDIQDQPYLELLYKFVNKSGYNLQAVKPVQPRLARNEKEESTADVNDASCMAAAVLI